MTAVVPGRQLVTTALLAMLRQSKADGGLGALVGDNQAPAFSKTQPDERIDYPYFVLFDIDGGGRSGDYVNEASDAQYVYQLTCVGRRRDQAQWAADRAQLAFLDGTLVDPAGLTVIRRSLDIPAGVTRFGETKQTEWAVPLRLRLDVATS